MFSALYYNEGTLSIVWKGMCTINRMHFEFHFRKARIKCLFNKGALALGRPGEPLISASLLSLPWTKAQRGEVICSRPRGKLTTKLRLELPGHPALAAHCIASEWQLQKHTGRGQLAPHFRVTWCHWSQWGGTEAVSPLSLGTRCFREMWGASTWKASGAGFDTELMQTELWPFRVSL